jgi:hypothetical protein
MYRNRRRQENNTKAPVGESPMENILEDDESLEHDGGDPSGTRTPDTLLKRQELYRLS